jgi:hypothetical protein
MVSPLWVPTGTLPRGINPTAPRATGQLPALPDTTMSAALGMCGATDRRHGEVGASGCRRVDVPMPLIDGQSREARQEVLHTCRARPSATDGDGCVR